jgi:acetate kinase
VRGRVCEGLRFAGLRLDPARNEAGAPVISQDDSPVTVRVMKTNEELMIARHVDRLVHAERSRL